eukprot:maker-scaffold_10-snap-gene-4.12-mRNA-1 protein AED:0.26 eAED:0.33 QI:0/0/0.5/1/0/0/2/506/86
MNVWVRLEASSKQRFEQPIFSKLENISDLNFYNHFKKITHWEITISGFQFITLLEGIKVFQVLFAQHFEITQVWRRDEYVSTLLQK